MTARTRIISVLDRNARRRDEHGYVLVLTAMLLIPLLLISAMAVDYGAWYTDGSRMQRAADAAALAGVVWLPDLTTATTVAQNTAKSDGYDDSLSNITVAVSKLSDYELKVVITDTAAKTFLSSFVSKTVTISRSATAKYVLPVPLGSPHNYFGTDNMISGSGAEGFYAAINGQCESKYQGDPFAVPYIANSAGSTNVCSHGVSYTNNGDYIDPSTADQYQYYITVPANRTQDIYVDIWNPGGNETNSTSSTTNDSDTITSTGTTKPTNSCSNGGYGSNYTCTTTITLVGAAGSNPWNNTYSCNNSAPYTCTWKYSSSLTFTITSTSNKPAKSGSNCSSSGGNYTCTVTVSTSQTASSSPTFACNNSSPYTCTITSSYTTTSSVETDDPTGSGSNVPTTIYTLYSADSTPLDDSDNPVLSASGDCGTSTYPNPFTADSSFDSSNRTILGQAGWYDMCIIPTTAPSGKYILGVKNNTDQTFGINGYAVMASYANNIGATCDYRTDTTCPEVSGKNWISIYANGSGSTATFFLAEIDQQYAGKTLQITLFDPGEGGNYIQVLDPTGTAQSFVATDEGTDDNTPGTPSSPETQLDVTNSKYNGHYVQLAISLPTSYGTSPALSQFWWQIKYVFSSGTVTDRTTWGVRVLGNPVHLTS